MWAFVQKNTAVLNRPKLKQGLLKIKEEKSGQNESVFVALSPEKSPKAGI